MDVRARGLVLAQAWRVLGALESGISPLSPISPLDDWTRDSGLGTREFGIGGRKRRRRLPTRA
jgi:hypothetical protein